MKQTLLVFTCAFLVGLQASAQGKKDFLWIDDSDYALKSFDKPLDFQQPTLSCYKSPNTRAGQDRSKLVVLSASGGGMRAAAFTLGVLLELERIGETGISTHATDPHNVLNEIDFFSTTSGGGWGTSSYIAYKYTVANGLQQECSTFNSFEKYLSQWARKSYFKGQTKWLIKSVGISSEMNRASSITMMDRLNKGYGGYSYLIDLERKRHGNHPSFDPNKVRPVMLRDVFTLKTEQREPLLPMMITNTSNVGLSKDKERGTNVSSFTLVPFTPDRLRFWGVQMYDSIDVSGLPDVAYYIKVKEKDTCGLGYLDIPLAMATKASSSVPGTIGATSFPAYFNNTIYHLYLEDGGIEDNFGLHTAKSILRQTASEVSDSNKRILFIVDAARSGIEIALPHRQTPTRFRTLKWVGTGAAPDAQYNISRENIQDLANEMNCKVVYLGTEALLNPKLGLSRPIDLPPIAVIEIDKAKAQLQMLAKEARNDPHYFSTKCSFKDRRLLYAYVRKKMKTWFSDLDTGDRGIEVKDPDETTGDAAVMMLAGRAVVQLEVQAIRRAMGYNTIEVTGQR